MHIMCQHDSNAFHVELRLVDPARNRKRFYEVIESRTLFGEACLRIVWGRIGHRPSHEHTELFADRAALVRRRDEVLRRRRHHGYELAVSRSPSTTLPESIAAMPATPNTPDPRAIEREIVEAHGLSPDDATARTLVTRWHAATRDIARYLAARGVQADLSDASTLAEMFVDACAA